MKNKKIDVFGCRVNSISKKEFLDKLYNLSLKKTGYISFVNAHMTITAYNDNKFMEVVNNSNIAVPDGAPIAFFMRFFYKLKQVRIRGMDVIEDIIYLAAKKKLKILFYGSTQEKLTLIEKKIKNLYPDLIFKSVSPPFRGLTDKEKNKYSSFINRYSPNIIIVFLGCPKQEKWMFENRNLTGCKLGLGGVADTFSGTIPGAPKVMLNFGLDWLWRFLQEPKRLWRRYLFTNLFFIFLVLKHTIRYLFRSLKKLIF